MPARKRPNILMLMTDQLTVTVLRQYAVSLGDPHRGRYAKTPHLDGLAARGVVFDHCYCQSPLCVPSRASLVSGRHPSAIGSFDNGSELPSGTPTLMHALRAGGYRTVLSGKMHFIGLDQLHGFEERLTADIYPTTLEWTPDWRRGVYLNPGASVKKLQLSANTENEMTSQMDYDNHVHRVGIKHLSRMRKEQKNGSDRRPFFMCVSWTHPHDPFRIPAKYWNRYSAGEIPSPAVGPGADPSPYQRWIGTHHGTDVYPPTLQQIQDARRAYYGMVSYVDDMVGEWLARLKALKLTDHTVVLFTSDHGEMLGEHGMWFKRTYHEPAVRVPLIVAHPGLAPGRRGIHIPSMISLVDLFPTFCDWSEIDAKSYKVDGRSFAKNAIGGAKIRPAVAYSEYLGEGTVAPLRAVRAGRWKYVYIHPPVAEMPGRAHTGALGGRRRVGDGGRSRPHELLFDLKQDPLEQKNLANGAAHQKVLRRMRRLCRADGWDPQRLAAEVLESQAARRQVVAALSAGPGRLAGQGFQGDGDYWGVQPPFPARN